MKNKLKFNYIVYVLAVFTIVPISTHIVYGQTPKKNTVRLRADYFKIMNDHIYFDIKASSKIDKQTIGVAHIDIIVSNLIDDEEKVLGTVQTNMEGIGRFSLKSLNLIKADSTNMYNMKFSFKGNDTFKKASKSVSFKDANIEAKLITKDSIHFVQARLFDANLNTPISERLLNVQLQRLFRPLRIGPEFNSTDINGTILVSIPEDIPGVNGNLTFEVVLNDSDDFGTVKALVKAPIGIPIVDESTFDERTMWSPRNKTPYLLLILPNLVIIAMWGLIIYLTINLFKISKP
jgi:hypothetical protein